MVDRRPESAQPSPWMFGLARRDSVSRRPDNEGVSAASVLRELQRVDSLAESGQLSGDRLIAASARLIEQSLFLSSLERNGVGIIVVGRGQLNQYGRLMSGGIQPFSTEIDVLYPVAGETTPTKVISIMDGELYEPHDPKDSKRFRIKELIDLPVKVLPHERATWLAKGIITINDLLYQLNDKDDSQLETKRRLSANRLALIDSYIRTARRSEILHPELHPLFFFDDYPSNRDRALLYMQVFDELNRDERLLDSSVLSVFGNLEHTFGVAFNRIKLNNARSADRRILKDPRPDYSLEELIEDPERARALEAYKERSETRRTQPRPYVEPIVLIQAAASIDSGSREPQLLAEPASNVAHGGEDKRDIALSRIMRLLQENHAEGSEETDLEEYNRLLKEMQIIAHESEDLSSLLIGRVEAAIRIILARGGNYTFRRVKQRDYEFGFPGLEQSETIPDLVIINRASSVGVRISENALEQGETSDNEAEKAAASALSKRIRNPEFIRTSR